MKKWMLRGFAVVLAVGLCTASVYAAGGHHGFRLTRDGCSVQPRAAQSCRYSDADGDGLCDLCGLPAGAGHSCRSDGICQVCGQAAGSCICAGTQHAQTPAAGSGGGHHGHHAGRGC